MQENASHAIAEALSALQDGQAVRAMAAAQSVLDMPADEAIDLQRAQALLCMAQCELRLNGRYLPALDHSQRATLAFQQIGDDAGEARALATHAIAATRLGHYEKAVDSGLMAVRLLESRPPGVDQVLAYHALAIAGHSGGSFEQARNAYERAIQVAQHCTPPLSTFELHTDLASTEAYRVTVERMAGGQRLSLDALERHVGECQRQLAAAQGDISLAPASHANNLLVLAITQVHLLAWQCRFDDALQALAHLRAEQQRLGRPWMQAAVHWAEAELAVAEGRREDALASAADMVAVAQAHGHEGLVAIGYHLTSYICELQHDDAGALRAMRQLAQRERQGRVESLKSRVHVIERQIELRHNRQRVQSLETDSRLFQKLAMEDVLTGLANRRQFEADVGSWLATEASPSAPLCLAMIDVDRFKAINDGYSHLLGDEVLKRIAHVLREQVREQDLPARLAGDEFVVVLRRTSIDAALAVCDRIQRAVADTAWSTLAPGLSVTISIGVAQAAEGDTLPELMRRSDTQMYARKRAAR